MYPDVEVSSYAHKDGWDRIGCCATHTPTGTEFACGILPTFAENEAAALEELRKHYPESITVSNTRTDYWQVSEDGTLLGEVVRLEAGWLAYVDECPVEEPFESPEDAIKWVYRVALAWADHLTLANWEELNNGEVASPEPLVDWVAQQIQARNEEHRWVFWPGGAR